MSGELHGEAGKEQAALLAPEDAPPPPLPLPAGLGTCSGPEVAPGPLATTLLSISCSQICQISTQLFEMKIIILFALALVAKKRYLKASRVRPCISWMPQSLMELMFP